MFDFTTITTAVIAFITAAMDIIDPTTLFGGLVTVSLSALVMVGVIKRVRGLIK